TATSSGCDRRRCVPRSWLWAHPLPRRSAWASAHRTQTHPAQTTVCSTNRYRKHRPMRCRYRFVLQTVGQPPVSPSAGWAPRVSVAPMQITSDTVALISGGASGLGEATARRMIAAGGAVVLLALPTSPGQDLADDLGERAVFVAGDVRDEGSVRGAVEAATSLG